MGRNNYDKTQRPSISDVFSALFESASDIFITLAEEYPILLWTFAVTTALILLTCWRPAAVREVIYKLLTPIFILLDLTIVPVILFIDSRIKKETKESKEVHSPGGPASAALAN